MKKFVLPIICFLIFGIFGLHLFANIRFMSSNPLAIKVLKFENDIKNKWQVFNDNTYEYLENKSKEGRIESTTQGKRVSIDKIEEIKKVKDYLPTTQIPCVDSVFFGNYYKNSTATKEPIEWLVLERKGNRALLISKNIVDAIKFDDNSVDYNDSYLRKYLNNDFYNNAFTEEEKKKIKKSGNPVIDIFSKDNVDTVGIDTVGVYFEVPQSVIPRGQYIAHSDFTPYASSKGNMKNYTSYWTKTYKKDNLIYGISNINCFTDYAITENAGIRPMIWVEYK